MERVKLIEMFHLKILKPYEKYGMNRKNVANPIPRVKMKTKYYISDKVLF